MQSEMTWGDLVGQARFLLQDTREGSYRFSDNQLLAGCHMACTTMKQVRPDLFYGRVTLTKEDSVCFPAPPYDDADLPEMLQRLSPFPEIYYQPVVIFITGWAEMINEEHSDTSRATALLNSFKAQILKAA